jgi:hypothetical protein
MKRGIILIILICTILLFTACGDSGADLETAQLTLGDMGCCDGGTVRAILNSLGVTAMSISATDGVGGILEFRYDPEEVSLRDIMNALAANGFVAQLA